MNDPSQTEVSMDLTESFTGTTILNTPPPVLVITGAAGMLGMTMVRYALLQNPRAKLVLVDKWADGPHRHLLRYLRDIPATADIQFVSHTEFLDVLSFPYILGGPVPPVRIFFAGACSNTKASMQEVMVDNVQWFSAQIMRSLPFVQSVYLNTKASLLGAQTPYSWSKQFIGHYLYRYAQTACHQFFLPNVYGLYEEHKLDANTASRVYAWTKAMRDNPANPVVELYKTPTVTRQHVYAEAVCALAYKHLMASPDEFARMPRLTEVVSTGAYDWEPLIHLIWEKLRERLPDLQPVTIRRLTPPPGFLAGYQRDNTGNIDMPETVQTVNVHLSDSVHGNTPGTVDNDIAAFVEHMLHPRLV